MLLAVTVAASSGTESKWSVARGSTNIATITLLKSGSDARAEWKKDAKSAPITFFLSKGKLYVRETGGEIDLDAYKGGEEKAIVAALLKADPSALKMLKVAANGATYTLERTSVANRDMDSATFTVRPKKSAASRLALMSADFLGPSSSGTSATAGGKGVTIVKLDERGDYAALQALENRDEKWRENLDKSLAEFQKSGKVGRSREEAQ